MNLAELNRESQQLLIVTTILMCIGIVMIYSASSYYAYEKFSDSAFYLKRHVLHCIFGVLIANLFLKHDYKKLKRFTRVFVILSIVGLILALLPGIGREAGGARRWVKLGFIGFQPSEFAGFFLIKIGRASCRERV